MLRRLVEFALGASIASICALVVLPVREIDTSRRIGSRARRRP
jgi:hypothetical protein